MKKTKKKAEIMEPIVITVKPLESYSEKRSSSPVFPKYQVLTNTPLPEGHIRSIALKDHKGMLDEIYEGDIIDLPERRFKTMSQRGLVEKYDGTKYPNKRR